MAYSNTYLISPRTVGGDLIQVMGRTSTWKLKSSLDEAVRVFVDAVESEERQRWMNTEATLDDIRKLTRSLLQKHPRFGNLFEANMLNDRKRKNVDGAIVESIRELWAKVSEPDTVATEEGRQIRRSILGAFCGESTTYVDVKDFVGGPLSREAFDGAKKRREDATETGEPYRM